MRITLSDLKTGGMAPVATLSLLCPLVFSAAWCDERKGSITDLRPSWIGKGNAAGWTPNVSFLNNLSFSHEGEPGLADELMDASVASRIQREYEEMNRDHETRRYHGLLNSQTVDERANRVNEISRQALDEVRTFQRNKQSRKVLGAIERNPSLKKPVAVAAAVAAVVTGNPYRTRIGGSTDLALSTNLPFQTGYIQFYSPIVNGAFTASGNPDSGNSMTLPPPSWVSRSEHYSFSLSRPLPVWGLGTGVSYGGSSNTVNASVSKELSSHLTCSVNTVRSVSSEPAYMREPEQTLKLDYQLHF